jgi:acetate kinase
VNAEGIEAARAALPDVPQVAVFDTAFHQTLLPHAYTYAVPADCATRYGRRRYGFHGTSHAFVSRRAARLLGREPSDVNLIVLHLGNGASATAVERDRSVDTSMGLTPLEGLVMGTRCGDIDPAPVFHLQRTAGLDPDEIDLVLNSASGIKALVGASDLREVHARVAAGDANAERALAVYCYRIRKHVGAYLAVLGHADAIVFTAGVDENDPVVRARTLEGAEHLGIRLANERNRAASTHPRVISPAGAPVAVLVMPTDEELQMAGEASELICR